MAKKQDESIKKQFKIIGQDAQMWFAQARQLKFSADLMKSKLKEVQLIPQTVPNIREQHFSFLHSYMLLTGLAIENLIKGILVGRDPTLFDDEKKMKKSLSNWGHSIEREADNILELTLDEVNLLKRIEGYLVWAGKYPLPLNSDNYLKSEKEKSRSYQSIDFALIDRLFERLAEILNKEWRAAS